MAIWIALLAVGICLIPVILKVKSGPPSLRKKNNGDGGTFAASGDTDSHRRDHSDQDSDSGSDSGDSGGGDGGGGDGGGGGD